MADVHRRAEVLRAEVHHMKRIKEQLMNEKSRCITDIKDLAQGRDYPIHFGMTHTRYESSPDYPKTYKDNPT